MTEYRRRMAYLSNDQHEALIKVAAALNAVGQRGPGLSSLCQMIGDLAINDMHALVAALESVRKEEMEFYNNVDELKENLRFHDNAEPVWSGEDGSYAVGVDFPADVEEGEVEYIRDGIVADWK